MATGPLEYGGAVQWSTVALYSGVRWRCTAAAPLSLTEDCTVERRRLTGGGRTVHCGPLVVLVVNTVHSAVIAGAQAGGPPPLENSHTPLYSTVQCNLCTVQCRGRFECSAPPVLGWRGGVEDRALLGSGLHSLHSLNCIHRTTLNKLHPL